MPDIQWVRKRDGSLQAFDVDKIQKAMVKAFTDTSEVASEPMLCHMSALVAGQLGDEEVNIEAIQDVVEHVLMDSGFHKTAKAYIIYREEHRKLRDASPVSEQDKAAIERNRLYFPAEIQIYQFISKYSRWLPEKSRRETWEEVVDRVIAYFQWHMTTHFSAVMILPGEWEEMRQAILHLEAMPAMRVVQMAGPSLQRCQVGTYNCASLPLDCLEAFAETLYMLMQGTGVGFSVESDFVEDLPKVKKQKGESAMLHVVDDSTEGWCNALLCGMQAWFAGLDVTFDVSGVRPPGARLKTKGGRASGPGPLVELLKFTRDKVLSRQGRRLRPIDAHDIACKIGKVVVVGGVRRAAMISFSDLDDHDMRHAKEGTEWIKTTPRTMANNATVYFERPDDATFMAEWLSLARAGTGERGIFNAGDLYKQMPARRHKRQVRCNPCGEANIFLNFCNLSIPVVRPDDSIETIERKVRMAARFGTLQSSMTNFKYLRPIWKQTCEEERLLGVDLLGASDNPHLAPSNQEAPRLLDKLLAAVLEENVAWSQRLGIKPSMAATVIKPSGNSSEFFQARSPLTNWESPYFIRRVRENAVSPVAQIMIDAGVPHSPEVDSTDPLHPAVWVFEFPCSAPSTAVFKNDLTAIDQLELWNRYKLHWTEHNPSATINVGPQEWMAVGAWVLNNWANVGGLSFLPRDDHVYQLAPLEPITKEEYEKRLAIFPKVPWEKLARFEREDHTDVAQELACTAGGCAL